MNHRKISKYLSFLLRHQPDALDLQIDAQGWVDIDELLEKINQEGTRLDRKTLEAIVKNSDKQRFKIDSQKNAIRANQGHSIPVDLALEAIVPPSFLYHGTATKYRAAILKKGISKMHRHHVHLSQDITTAKRVGCRHGYPVVFEIDSEAMHAAGQVFYCSENNVWLTDYVAPQYLRIID